MSWTLKHTGGLDIDIFLYCDNSRDHRATKVLLCQQDECYNSNNQLMGSTLLGPIVIDEVYTCSIIAVNTKGIDTRRFDNITSVQGMGIVVNDNPILLIIFHRSTFSSICSSVSISIFTIIVNS